MLFCCLIYSIIASLFLVFFFFTDTATTEIYTLSLHDALPIFDRDLREPPRLRDPAHAFVRSKIGQERARGRRRSEEHTSELQSPYDLVCRLLLEKKKKKKKTKTIKR